LETTTIDHHKEFVALYPECVKFKPHYQLHVAPAVRRHRTMMTCFGCERKSKFTKEIASHCFKKCTETIASYELRRLLKAIQDPQSYGAVQLRGKLQECPDRISQQLLPAAWMIRKVMLGKVMVTTKGSFSKGDVVVWFQSGTENLRAGKILGFMCATGLRETHHVASIAMYLHQDGFVWSTVDPPTVLVSASLLLLTVPWHVDDKMADCVRLIVPQVIR
jgi:hypothetical protein